MGLKSDEITITGGNPLKGRIAVRGAKNLATKAMVAALLGETPSTLRDVPDISDVEVVRRPAVAPATLVNASRGTVTSVAPAASAAMPAAATAAAQAVPALAAKSSSRAVARV